MEKIKKEFNFKIIAISLSMALCFVDAVYSENLLRIPVDTLDLDNRMRKTYEKIYIKKTLTREEYKRIIDIVNRARVVESFNSIQEALIYVKQKCNEIIKKKPVIFLLDSKGIRGKTIMRKAIMSPGRYNPDVYGYSTNMFNPQEILPIADLVFQSIFNHIRTNSLGAQHYQPLQYQLLLDDREIISKYNLSYYEYLGYYFDKHLAYILKQENKKIILWDEAGSEDYFKGAIPYQRELSVPVTVICLKLEGTEKNIVASVSYWDWGKADIFEKNLQIPQNRLTSKTDLNKAFVSLQRAASDMETAINDTDIKQLIAELLEARYNKKGEKPLSQVSSLITDITQKQRDVLKKINKTRRKYQGYSVSFIDPKGEIIRFYILYDLIDKWKKAFKLLNLNYLNGITEDEADEAIVAFFRRINGYFKLLDDIKFSGEDVAALSENMRENKGDPQSTYNFLAYYRMILEKEPMAISAKNLTNLNNGQETVGASL